jgi:16S rRNA (cytosine967-C5)-methyltransferase
MPAEGEVTGGERAAKARMCAYAVIRRVFEQGAYADQALHSEARELDARDRALAMRLAYGAVQRRGTTDHLIERLAERPVSRLDPTVRAALRMGLYELLYLHGSPDHAVVADAVELSKGDGRDERSNRGHSRARQGGHGPGQARGGGHGLVNAVLRRAIREGGSALLDALGEDTPERAAVKHSHPAWLAKMWWQQLGAAQARELMAADNQPSEVALRANTLIADAAILARELAAAGVALHRDPQLPEALVLDGPFDLHAAPQWRAGALLAQSRAAMHVARVLDPQPGERVLDLCAAPGGKSTHLAALMQDRGEVVAVEHNRRRAAELTRAAARLRADSVRVELADATIVRRHEAPFDRVLVDPPCSGLGTLQARADLRWRVTQQSIAELVVIQQAILAAAAAVVRPGGVLVYSTCTISQAENEHQIASFVEHNPDFALSGQPHMTLPHRDHTAGFYIAKLQRS